MIDKLTPKSASIRAIHAFSSAWSQAGSAYGKLEINSERCLQAFLYSELRKLLPESGFRIYIEPRILKAEHHQETSQDADEDDIQAYKKESHIDTIIAYEKAVVLAIELKFNPRGKPKPVTLKKDLASLSHMLDPGTKVNIKRVNGPGDELHATSFTRIALGIFFAGNGKNSLQIDDTFFGKNRPTLQQKPIEKWLNMASPPDGVEIGPRSRTLPYRLYIFGAETSYHKEDKKYVVKITQICNKSYHKEFRNINECNKL